MRKLAVLIAVLLMVFMTVGVSSAAAPAPDPACTGSLTRQLSADTASPNSHGFVAHVFSSLRFTPDGATKKVIFAPGSFNVFDDASTVALTGLHNPTCKTNVLWWYIQYSDVPGQPAGWALESQVNSIFGSNQYWLNAGTPVDNPPTACPGGPSFGLIPGGTGQIAQVFSTLRPAPGAAGTRVNAPATFNVVAAALVPGGYTQPTCAGGLAYWYIDYGGTIGAGWASEGQGGTRWLQNTTPPPPPAPAAGG